MWWQCGGNVVWQCDGNVMAMWWQCGGNVKEVCCVLVWHCGVAMWWQRKRGMLCWGVVLWWWGVVGCGCG